MPRCDECKRWHPTQHPRNPDYDFLIIAYHDKNCSVRLQDWEGDLDKYEFRGGVLFETTDKGQIPISTFVEFPAPYKMNNTPHTLPAVSPTAVVYKWEEFLAKRKGYGEAAIRSMGKSGFGPKPVESNQVSYRRYSGPEDDLGNYGNTHSWGPNGYSHGHGHNQTHGRTWQHTPAKTMYDGIDKTKFPGTYKWLFKFSFMPDYNKNTRYGPDPKVGSQVQDKKAEPETVEDSTYYWE